MCQARISHCSQLPPGHVPPSLPLCLGDSLPDVISTPLSALSRVVASRRRGTAASHSTGTTAARTERPKPRAPGHRPLPPQKPAPAGTRLTQPELPPGAAQTPRGDSTGLPPPALGGEGHVHLRLTAGGRSRVTEPPCVEGRRRGRAASRTPHCVLLNTAHAGSSGPGADPAPAQPPSTPQNVADPLAGRTRGDGMPPA